MEKFVLLLELIGTVAFAVSGAVTALKKQMDVFGVCIMGVTAACGGGAVRDVLLGRVPPVMFCEPVYALTAVLTSLVTFFLALRRVAWMRSHLFERLLLVSDAVGLGVFTAVGVDAAVRTGFAGESFFTVFLAVLTGVGGGVLRDVMAGDRPYIFVKHFYACASLIGALLCRALWEVAGRAGAMLLCLLAVSVLRVLAARYRWSLPKAPLD